ncbi:hypothetical protein BCSJ1_26178, partial [Bacillus cereus SJ1]
TVCEANLVEVKNDRGEHRQGDRHPFRLQGHIGQHRDQGQGHHPDRRRRLPAHPDRGRAAQQAHQAQCGRAFSGHGRCAEDGRRQGQAGHQGAQRHRERVGQEDPEADEGKQAQGASRHPGGQGTHYRRQARRPAGGHGV